MKKFILFFFAMVLGFATGMAREIVFDAAVSPGVNEYNDGDGSYVAADQSVTIGGVTIASPACVWYNVDPTKNQYRIYKGKDLTITSTVGPIVKVEFSCTASGTTKYGPGCFSEMEGYSYEGKIGVWTGEAEELVFHSESNQVRAEKIVVTLAEGGAVEPVLSAEDVNAKHSYYIYTDARGGLTIMDENATNLVGTAEAGVGQEVDATNPLQQFAFVNYEDALYLYSVGAGKFVNAAAKGILEDTPKTPILFKEAGENDVMLYFDDKHNFNLGGSKQVTIDGWSNKDAGNSFHIMLAESFDPAPVIAALEEAKNGSAVVTYNYTIGGRVWKTVTSEQKKGETVAAPAEQAFVNIVSYNEDVVAEGLVVNVVCEEALPFTTSTEAKPVYGYLRGHSNQIRYIYVNEEGAGMDTGNLQEEMTEFADNYLWFISGNLLDGFQLHNKAYGVLRATEGQTSVNGEANSVWQLRAGSAGSKLTENIFALWAEGVTYMNCQGGLKYWDDNDAGSTFTFNVVETEEPEPTAVTFEFTDNEDGTITITPSDLKALYFFNIYSDRTNTEYQQGTDAEAIAGDVAQNLTAPESEVHTGVSVVDPAAWLQYWFGGYVQYTAGDYRLGVVELAYDGTYSMAGEPVFHAFTKAAEVEPVDPVTGSIATITAVFPNGNKHVVYSNGEKLTAGVEAPEGAVVKFDVVSRTENTLVLKAGDQYIHWTSGDNNEKSADLDGLNEDFDETLNTLTLAPATLQGCSTSATWGKTEEDVQGLYRLQGMGTNGRLFDFTLREFDDAWIAGDPGNIFFDTNWDGNGCRTSFFEITFEEESTEETFPMEGVAYKFKNVDSQLYVKVVEDAEQCVTLGQTPDEMFFTKVDGGWAISNSKGYQLGSTAKGWNIGNTATPIVWTIEEVEGGYAFKNEKGYLGYDTAAAGQKAFRDKNYTTHHGIFNIWKYDEEEIIVEPEKTLEETWANIHTLLAEAEAIKELNEVTVTYDADGYFEDFTSPIVGKVGYKKHDDVWAVCDGADYVNSFVSYFETAAEADAYLADFGGLAALEEIITNVIDDYNAAEVVLPTPGKTYVIRNYPYTYSDEYSYAYYYNGEKLALSESANATTAEYMWTVSEPVKYSYFDADLNVIEETRYQFVNAADNTKFMSWRGNGTDNYAGVTTNAADANSKWYLTGKKVDGTAAHAYGTIALRTNADGNQYRTAVVDMRKNTDHLGKSNGDHFDATYSSWFIFEEVEIPVTEWDGSEPVVEVQDATTVKVTFTDAHSVEASNFGVLGAIFDEQGDVTAIVFNDLFEDGVKFGTDYAILNFKKISEINAELAEAAKGMASKVTAAANGDVKGKVVICSKSFKIDDNYLYNETIVRDFETYGNITGIDAIATDSNTKIFDLQGRRVVLPAKGVFVKDGRKVVK